MVFVDKMPASKRSATTTSEDKCKKQKTTKHVDEEMTAPVKQRHKTTGKKSASKRTYPKDITKESLKIDVSFIQLNVSGLYNAKIVIGHEGF